MCFPKENFSNGRIATVDVIYPSAPFAPAFNPALLRAQLLPVLDYARMDRVECIEFCAQGGNPVCQGRKRLPKRE